jgi:ADP-heptose:LPS heptosyltransferase
VKFLLIQLRRIGDVLMTTPSIRLLSESFPEAELTFLTEAPADQVLQENPFLHEILLYRKPESFSETISFFRKLRARQFDCVIDFFGNPRSAFMSRFSGAPIRIGFNFRGRGWAYTHPVDISTKVTYAAQDKAQLLGPLGISANDFGLDFFADEKDKKYAAQLFEQLEIEDSDFVVSLSPVSRQPYKVWPPERFAMIADWLVENYKAKILYLFGPGEGHFIDAVRKAMKKKALPDYDTPSLSETLAILNRVDLHLGNDNGPRHFAVACGTPTLTIFGRPWAANWTPPQPTQHRALEFDPGCKNKCTFPKCELECLHGVTVEAVQTELEKMIKTLN